MTVVLALLICIFAFGVGFLFGVSREPEKSTPKFKGDNSENEKLIEEYRNFLNYDGSEQ